MSIPIGYGGEDRRKRENRLKREVTSAEQREEGRVQKWVEIGKDALDAPDDLAGPAPDKADA